MIASRWLKGGVVVTLGVAGLVLAGSVFASIIGVAAPLGIVVVAFIVGVCWGTVGLIKNYP